MRRSCNSVTRKSESGVAAAATIFKAAFALLPFLWLSGRSLPAPAFSDLLENAPQAVLATVLEISEKTRGRIHGHDLLLKRGEVLWGEVPETFRAWVPASACNSLPLSSELIVGLRRPPEKLARFFGLPSGMFLAVSLLPPRSDFVSALKKLHNASDSKALIALLDDPSAQTRREALRQLCKRFLQKPDPALLLKLLPRAARESDPQTVAAYMTTFGHFRFAQAEPIVTERLLTAQDECAAVSAQWAFPRVASPGAYKRLIHAYRYSGRKVKSRILRVMAASKLPEAQALLTEALNNEETALAALQALKAAGAPVVRPALRITDPIKARRIKKLLREKPPVRSIRIQRKGVEEGRGDTR